MTPSVLMQKIENFSVLVGNMELVFQRSIIFPQKIIAMIKSCRQLIMLILLLFVAETLSLLRSSMFYNSFTLIQK